jgi:hypothetical protein
VLYQDEHVVLLPDFKFHNLKEVQSLHLLCIFKSPHLHSIRDLNESHLSLLERTETMLQQQIEKSFDGNIKF